MEIKVVRVPKSKKQIIHNLLQLYLYEFNGMLPDEKKFRLNQEGEFDYEYFEDYWREKSRAAYLVTVDNEIAGFVLIHQHSMLHASYKTDVMGEFFVLRQYRNKGVGTEVVRMIFQQHPGEWEISVIKENGTALLFWQQALEKVITGEIKLKEAITPEWPGTVILVKV